MFELACDKTFLWSRTKVFVIGERFDTEVDNCSAYLHSFVESRNQSSSVFYKDKGAKLG